MTRQHPHSAHETLYLAAVLLILIALGWAAFGRSGASDGGGWGWESIWWQL